MSLMASFRAVLVWNLIESVSGGVSFIPFCFGSLGNVDVVCRYLSLFLLYCDISI